MTMLPHDPTGTGTRKRLALAAVVCAIGSVPLAALIKLATPGWLVVGLLLYSPILLVAWVLGLVGAFRIYARPTRHGAGKSATVILWSLLVVLSMALAGDADDRRSYPSPAENALGVSLGRNEGLIIGMILLGWSVLGLGIFLSTLGTDPNANGQGTANRPS